MTVARKLALSGGVVPIRISPDVGSARDSISFIPCRSSSKAMRLRCISASRRKEENAPRMEQGGYPRPEGAFKKQNSCCQDFSRNEADARRASSASTQAWDLARPSPLGGKFLRPPRVGLEWLGRAISNE